MVNNIYNNLFKGALLLFVSALSLSCLSDKKDNDSIWIKKLRIIPSHHGPNPSVIVFTIHTNSELKEVLLSEKWDSVKFSGGYFDTINYNNRIIGIAESENQDELILGMRGAFYMFTEEELDSIVSLTFKEVEINFYYKDNIWTLKPIEKKEYILLSEKRDDNIWIEEFKIRNGYAAIPAKVFFTVHTNNDLKDLLLSEIWDSVKFSGGFFDSINFNKRIIDFTELENKNELIFEIVTDKFLIYKEYQLDSITSFTFKKLEIDIYYKDYHWTLKPREMP